MFDRSLATLAANYRRDLNNFRVVQQDMHAGAPPLLAPDCSDLIEFIHIIDARLIQVDHPYREGIRRYFLENPKLVFLPSWMYEFLSYMHKVIVENIAQFSTSNGLEDFQSQYKESRAFVDLWNAGRYAEAETIFNPSSKWAQILALAQDKNVQFMVGQPLQAFNYLVESGKLVPASELVEKGLGCDADTRQRVLRQLATLRSAPEDRLKNEVDAHSFGTVAWMDKSQAERYSAVTMSTAPRDAYYGAMEDASSDAPLVVRSSIAPWIRTRIDQAIKTDATRYVDEAVVRLEEILREIKSFQALQVPVSVKATDVLNPSAVYAIRKRSELGSLMDEYEVFYREPILEPILQMGSRARERKLLRADQAAEMMQQSIFEERMREATNALRDDAQTMISRSRPFTAAGAKTSLSGRPLHLLVDRIVRDFEKNIY